VITYYLFFRAEASGGDDPEKSARALLAGYESTQGEFLDIERRENVEVRLSNSKDWLVRLCPSHVD
jgi:hypothetical protein